MKQVSPWWSLLIGTLSPLAQIGIFASRFGRIPTDSTVLDYVMFFLAGAAGGYLLILFLNRALTMKARWLVVVAFLLATPIALVMMVGGGLLGPVGVLIFPLVPWGALTGLGSVIGNWIWKG